MKKTYQGSCHCGAVRFEVDADLAAETSRCNCSVCTKVRLWKTVVAPAGVRVLQGEDALAEFLPCRGYDRFQCEGLQGALFGFQVI